MSDNSDLDHLLARLVQRTAELLQNSPPELRQIQWQDGEANTDSGYSQLARDKFQQAFTELLANQYPGIQLTHLTEPDISFTIKLNSHSLIGKIELKSGIAKSNKSTTIPGSTIGDLDLNMWVIFCKKSSDKQNFEFRYGRYFRGIFDSPTILFQDRSPRPRISWDGYQPIDQTPNMEQIDASEGWIKRYAEAAINRISGQYKVKHSWQDDLVREIIKIARERGINEEQN